MKDFFQNDRHLFLLLSLAAFAGIYFLLHKQTERSQPNNKPHQLAQAEHSLSADTFIPAGYVLVPLQIENAASLTGLIENFAVVDLYHSDDASSGYKLFLSRIKLLRAPLDASQFAVLVTDTQAASILSLKTPFRVVLQNRKVLNAKTEVFALSENSDLKIETKRQQSLSEYQEKSLSKKSRFKNKKEPKSTHVRIEYQL